MRLNPSAQPKITVTGSQDEKSPMTLQLFQRMEISSARVKQKFTALEMPAFPKVHRFPEMKFA